MNRLLCFAVMSLSGLTLAGAQTPTAVPTAPPDHGVAQTFRDGRFGVQFRVPSGWTFTRKDGQISTFRLDARSAGPQSEMRAVAGIGFNPYPLSTLSGALFYYSVERHTTEADCERQATGFGPAHMVPQNDIQDVGGMDFTHGHDEHGQICVEARDEVYTAYRRHSCYRFDLTVNTFCSISSGAQDLTDEQMHDIEQRMTHILSTVTLNWEKSGPVAVPVPRPAPVRRRLATPSVPAPAVAGAFGAL